MRKVAKGVSNSQHKNLSPIAHAICEEMARDHLEEQEKDSQVETGDLSVGALNQTKDEVHTQPYPPHI